MLAVWSTVPNAPKIVPWAPLTSDGDMFSVMLQKLAQYPNLEFIYQGKPLALVVHNSYYPMDMTKYNQFSQNYTLRRMWAYQAGAGMPASNWSFMENCQSGFLASQATIPCQQRISVLNGALEEVSVVPSYQLPYASDITTDVPKFQGRTFVQQFATAYQHPEVPIVTIASWNDWQAQRGCLLPDGTTGWASPPCNNTNDHFPNGTKVFVDGYDYEHGRDIEPSKDAPYDYYYQLLKDCITKFRQGQMCSASDIPYIAPVQRQHL
jgi:hypothetical protein